MPSSARKKKTLAFEGVAGGAAHRASDRGRRDLLPRQSAENRRRRMGAAAIRRLDGAPDAHMAARYRDPRTKKSPHRGAARDLDPQPRKESAAHRAGYRGLPDQRARIHADRIATQSQAQQGAA